METVSSFVAALAAATRPERAASWDPVGLQLGDPSGPVRRVGVCHEVTERVMQLVLAEPPDLLVTYHPLLFRPTTRLVAGPTATGRAWRLVAGGVALAVTHTDFDVAAGGSADSLAEAVGLRTPESFGVIAGADTVKVVVFVPEEAANGVAAAMSAAGAGRIGNYTHCSFRVTGEGRFFAGEGAEPVVGRPREVTVAPEVRLEIVAPASAEDGVVSALVAAHPYEEPAFDVYPARSNPGFIGRVGAWSGTLAELADRAGNLSDRRGLRVGGRLDATVERVAVIPGSGGPYLKAARSAGAGAVVTGDVDHHRAVEAIDSGLAVVDPGHAATELPGMRKLVDLVAGLGVEVSDLTGDGTGPWADLGD